MNKKIAFYGLLAFISVSTLNSMELATTTNKLLLNLPNDSFVNIICPSLNRQERDALRCTSKNYLEIVYSQDELNKRYAEACNKKNNSARIYWGNMGGLLPHQEFAKAIHNNKKSLAHWLIATERVIVWDAYCSNIKDALKASQIDQILPVITWLLNTRKPVIHLGEFLSGYHITNNRIAQYPEAKKILSLFTEYENNRKGTANPYTDDRCP